MICSEYYTRFAAAFIFVFSVQPRQLVLSGSRWLGDVFPAHDRAVVALIGHVVVAAAFQVRLHLLIELHTVLPRPATRLPVKAKRLIKHNWISAHSVFQDGASIVDGSFTLVSIFGDLLYLDLVEEWIFQFHLVTAITLLLHRLDGKVEIHICIV